MRSTSLVLLACLASTGCGGTSLEPQPDEPTAGSGSDDNSAGSGSGWSSSAGSSSAGTQQLGGQ